MTTHISRDFNPSASGYVSSISYMPYLYNLAIFLKTVMGFSTVGQSGFDVSNTNSQTLTNAATTPIAAASDGQSLPQATINVISTSGFPSSGNVYIATNLGTQIVTYVGLTTTAFLNCSGGTGTMTASSLSTITAASNGATLPQATINVTATATASTTIAAGSNGVSLPTGTINVASNVGFPTSGTLNVTTGAGVQTVAYTGLTGTTQFTGCTGGTGTMSTGGAVNNTGFFVNFAASGTIYVITTTGPQIVTYTGKTATTFTGCSGGTGSMATGNSVTSVGGSATYGQNKITAATGAPWTITTTFPHGMSTGDYALITGAGVINISFTPVPVQVLNATQMVLLTTAGGSGYVFNSQTLVPPGMLIASGTGASINTTGAPSVYAVSVPPNTRTVLSGTAPASGDVGRLLVLKSNLYPTKNSGIFKTTAVNTGNSTTIIAASNSQTLPQSTINVASTTGFPASGTIFVYTSTGVQTVTYTGGGGGGTTFTGCTGGTGLMTTGNTVDNFNGYTIDYRSSDTPPTESGMSWWLYETEVQASNYVLLPDNNRSVYGLLATTNTSPIQITYNINVVGYFLTGQKVTISGVTGNTNANGTWVATVNGGNTILLNGSSGNGTSGVVGTISRPGYAGNNVNSRIILQSPHSTGWQVRIALEPFNVPSVVPLNSISIGAGGNSTGDFPIGGVTTHTAQYLDITIPSGSPYVNTYTGSARNDQVPRVTIVGDDAGRSLFLYTKTLSAGNNGLLVLGLPDNEPTPLPININRAFVYGGVNSSPDYGTIAMRLGPTFNLGFTFRDQAPEACAIAGWANADGVSGTGPGFSANAGDSPFTNTTEVLPWEVWGGVVTDISLNLPFPSGGNTIYGLNQRFMGTAPYLRQGRTNFGTFTLSTDNTTAFSVSTTTGTAVSPIQITTVASNALVTGQTVVISGVLGNTAANGTFVITVIDNTHFTLNNTTGNGTYTSGGSGNGTQQWLHLQNGIYLAWNGAGGLTP